MRLVWQGNGRSIVSCRIELGGRISHFMVTAITALPRNVLVGLVRFLPGLSAFALALVRAEKKEDVFNLLWVLVFGFATLNILGLVARRFDSGRSGMSFGEILAVLVVFVSLALLGWEMLTIFKILPFKLKPR